MTPYIILVVFLIGALAGWLLRERLDRMASEEWQADDDYAIRTEK